MLQKDASTGSGTLSPRYGRFCRKMVNESEKISCAKHLCPVCDTIAVKRVGTGIWECRKCIGYKYEFSGGAYVPQTPGLKVVLRAIETKGV